MLLPPRPILLAAKRWLELLASDSSVPRAQALLSTHREYSDLTPTQYATALTLLRDLGLLEQTGSPTRTGSNILRAVFEKADLPWVQDADLLVRSPDELPADIVSAGETLGLGASEVFEELVSSWGRVDTAARKRVGAAGESALVALLQQQTDLDVDHVALRSDGFGYDIAVTLRGVSRCHLEVKSTTRINRLTAYLSRHEYNTMLRDEAWVLVTVRLSADLEIVGVGSVSKDWIVANAPADAGPFGRWESVKLELPPDAVNSGIHQLGEPAVEVLPPWRYP